MESQGGTGKHLCPVCSTTSPGRLPSHNSNIEKLPEVELGLADLMERGKSGGGRRPETFYLRGNKSYVGTQHDTNFKPGTLPR